jgi:hypothetical protein
MINNVITNYRIAKKITALSDTHLDSSKGDSNKETVFSFLRFFRILSVNGLVLFLYTVHIVFRLASTEKMMLEDIICFSLVALIGLMLLSHFMIIQIKTERVMITLSLHEQDETSEHYKIFTGEELMKYFDEIKKSTFFKRRDDASELKYFAYMQIVAEAAMNVSIIIIFLGMFCISFVALAAASCLGAG